MSDTKTFATLAVGSAATGIGLCDGLSYALMGEIAEHVLGHPVWTHELGDKLTTARIHAAIYAQLPLLPTEEEARADWHAAAEKATKAYGRNVALQRGHEERTEGPVESLARMTGRPEDIAVVSTESLK